jgi:hypothetical protein
VIDFVQQVRLAIYEMTVADGRVPSFEELAAARGLAAESVADAYRALADAHVIVLEHGSMNIWSAPPFSAVPTRFNVYIPQEDADIVARSWRAPCAWDAFGISAVLRSDVIIITRCPESGESLGCGVHDGNAVGSGIIHLEVPAKHFWDDIFYT